MKRKNALAIIAVLTSLFYIGAGSALASEYGSGDKRLVLNAKGVGTAYVCEIPPTALGTTIAYCFDVPLLNPNTGETVGMLTSSLADVVHVDPNEPSRMFATITSSFKLGSSKLVTRGPGSVQPFTGGSPTMTHMTGAIPSPGENNVLYGTGRFVAATGSVRESGAVNLSVFRGQPGDNITYDLLFVITLN